MMVDLLVPKAATIKWYGVLFWLAALIRWSAFFTVEALVRCKLLDLQKLDIDKVVSEEARHKTFGFDGIVVVDPVLAVVPILFILYSANND